MEIKFITSNSAKVKIARERLTRYGITVRQGTFEFGELQSIDVEEVAMHKARQILNVMDENFIIDDSGFFADALHGFPGALTKPVIATLGDSIFLKLLSDQKNRNASFKSVLVYGDIKTKKLHAFVSECKGKIPDEPRGKMVKDFTMSRIFIPLDFKKTVAELDEKEWKNFLDRIRKNDHYEKFGVWISKNKNKK